ncbi:MAG: hypothetical protein K5695_05965 [Oscillospiraceae bacterium]|nr:hypothetical protein [Oscillospiraceae bacterium]
MKNTAFMKMAISAAMAAMVVAAGAGAVVSSDLRYPPMLQASAASAEDAEMLPVPDLFAFSEETTLIFPIRQTVGVRV